MSDTQTALPYAPDQSLGPRAAFEANRGNTDEVGGVAAYEYLRNWHNDVHDGVVQHCLREPCYGLTEILRG